MAANWTNRGFYRLLGTLRGNALPTNFYLALVTSAVAATEDTTTLGSLTQIASGNGYTSGGIQISLNATDFDTWTEDATANTAFVRLKDMIWTATGGDFPASGSGAAQAVLTDDNATIGDREVWAFADVSSGSATSGQTYKIPDFELQLAKT